jgi:hypothetical protein
MANVAVTHTVIHTAAANYAAPNQTPQLIKCKNLDNTHTLWVALFDGTVAAQFGDECEAVGPGEAVVLPWRTQYSMIADGGSIKANLAAQQGR